MYSFPKFLKKFLVFYLIYNIAFAEGWLLIGAVLEKAVGKGSDLITLLGVPVFLMLWGGLFLCSAGYGIYFFYRNNITFLQLLLLSTILFFIGAIAFYPWYPIGKYHNLQNLCNVSGQQAIGFFLGNVIGKIVKRVS